MKKLNLILGMIVAAIIISCTTKESLTQAIEGNTTDTIEDFFLAYSLVNAEYGTETVVTIEGDTRVMVTNALPNHDTGEFPGVGNPNTISAQNRTYRIPYHLITFKHK